MQIIFKKMECQLRKKKQHFPHISLFELEHWIFIDEKIFFIYYCIFFFSVVQREYCINLFENALNNRIIFYAHKACFFLTMFC